MRKFLKYTRDENGATAVEFAMISVLFLTFIFGIIETARLVWTWNTLQYAMGQTVRYALTNADAPGAELTDYAADTMTAMQVNPANLSVTVTTTFVSGIEMIEASGTYVLDFLLPLPAGLESITLTSSAQLALPQDP